MTKYQEAYISMLSHSVCLSVFSLFSEEENQGPKFTWVMSFPKICKSQVLTQVDINLPFKLRKSEMEIARALAITVAEDVSTSILASICHLGIKCTG